MLLMAIAFPYPFLLLNSSINRRCRWFRGSGHDVLDPLGLLAELSYLFPALAACPVGLLPIRVVLKNELKEPLVELLMENERFISNGFTTQLTDSLSHNWVVLS